MPKFLRHLLGALLAAIISAANAHKATLEAEVETVAAAAGSSPSADHVNAAIDKILPVYARPIVDGLLKNEEAQLIAALAAGAPAFVDKVLEILGAEQKKLAA